MFGFFRFLYKKRLAVICKYKIYPHHDFIKITYLQRQGIFEAYNETNSYKPDLIMGHPKLIIPNPELPPLLKSSHQRCSCQF